MRNDAFHDTELSTQRLGQDAERAPSAGADLRRGDVLAGRYQIEELLGKGGMASVYRAFDRVTEQAIAIKALDSERSAGAAWVEHLGRELRHARRIQHPNVCRVFDFFEDDGFCFLTMELAEAGTLRETLDAGARPLTDRLADAQALIDGAAAIHEAGVVHRDLKPENVLRASGGRLMVSDLGIAIRADLTTHSAGAAGTHSYMAPELMFGERATKASDVWSLGVVLHEVILGARPEWTTSAAGVRRLCPPAGQRSDQLAALERLCARCLLENPTRRLQDAAVVREQFARAISERPGAGRARRRALAAAALVLVVATVLAVKGRLSASGGGRVATGGIVGQALDLARSSTPILAATRRVSCLQVLPGGKAARVFYSEPAEVLDVDLATRHISVPRLAPEVMNGGCPQLSPDGGRLLFQRERPGKAPEILLSPRADGADAQVVTEGDCPQWLGSGEAFVYRFDNARVAVMALGKGPVMFSAGSPSPTRLLDAAVSAAGDRIAVLSTEADRTRTLLDLYDYPSAALIRRWSLPAQISWITFDKQRGTWQLSSPQGRYAQRCELTEAGDCALLAALPGADVLGSFRSELGLLMFSDRLSNSTVVRSRRDGSEREYFDDQLAPPDVSDSGDVLFTVLQDDGRRVIALQGRNDARPHPITSGGLDVQPAFGPDGQTFIYTRTQEQAVVSCRLRDGAAEQCQVLHKDPAGPGFPRLSPDGGRLAYTTLHGATERVRIVSLADGQVRELEKPSSQGWYLRWSSPTTLWTCGHQTGWSEVDVLSGALTGRTQPALDGKPACQESPPGTGQPRQFETRRARVHSFELRLARGI